MDWTTFKEMPFRKKIQWILHYYGLAIVAVITVIAVVFTLLYRMFGPHTDSLVKILILDERCSDEDRMLIHKELTELFGDECEVTSYVPNVEEQFRAFVVRLTGDEVDFVIAPETQIKELENNQYFQEIYKLSDDCHYYRLTDEEGYYTEKDIYMGRTEQREIALDILEKTKDYFLE